MRMRMISSDNTASADCRVITYGTFDLFHGGHRLLLERARELGTYLIVGVTSDSFDVRRGKLNVRQSLVERIMGVRDSGLADEIIVEEFQGQKLQDIKNHRIDVFTVGSDWAGHFDSLGELCKVVYLERTPSISSTALRGEVKFGIIGCGRIAGRFVAEAKFVSGVKVECVVSRNLDTAQKFAKAKGILHAFATAQEMIEHGAIDAVYIASPHLTHVPYATMALRAGKHVLCEKPLSFKGNEAEALYTLAEENDVVLLEAIKTAFMPGFRQMVAAAQSGEIGNISSVSATCTMIRQRGGREFDISQGGGSLSELATYPLMAIVKLLGHESIHSNINCYSIVDEGMGVDIFSRINIVCKAALATASVGLGVKAEGDLVVAGTKGYIYIPAPWWLTKSFDIRFEDSTLNKTFSMPMDGDGLRYELAEFAKMIHSGRRESPDLTREESCALARCMEAAKQNAQAV